MKHSPITVLIADDDDTVLTTLKPGLTHAGYKVLLADDGEKALTLCLEKHPDIALLDLNMPNISGLEIAKILHQQSDIPFMLISVDDNDELIQTAAKVGALGYLVKPMHATQIAAIIETALQRANDLNDLRKDKTQLLISLDNGRDINIATGILMERFHISSDQAIDHLRHASRSQRKKLLTLAKNIVQASNTLNHLSPACNNKKQGKPK